MREGSVNEGSVTLDDGRLLAAIERAIPEEVRLIGRVLAEAGFRVWLVGGSVRDLIRAAQDPHVPPRTGDFDLCTDAKPERMLSLFRKVIPTGIAHGTVTVVLKGQHFEVTTLRGEGAYSDGRHPDAVFFVDDLEQDLARRDFTINAMAYDLAQKTLSDPFGGRRDLEAKVLRAVGNPGARFSEDGLRVLRCARFAATLGFDVEEATRAAIAPSRGSFSKVAAERVRDEWMKALSSPWPSRFLRIVRAEGLLDVTCPELFPRGESRLDDRYEELLALEDASDSDPLLRLVLFVLLAAEANPEDKGPSERASVLAALLASRLRLSGAERHVITHLAPLAATVRQTPTETVQGPWLRRFLSALGRDEIPRFVRLLHAASSPNGAAREQADLVERRVAGELQRGAVLSLRELAVTGSDLIREAGLPAGPGIGRVLAALLETTFEDPSKNQRDVLLSLARALH